MQRFKMHIFKIGEAAWRRSVQWQCPAEHFRLERPSEVQCCSLPGVHFLWVRNETTEVAGGVVWCGNARPEAKALGLQLCYHDVACLGKICLGILPLADVSISLNTSYLAGALRFPYPGTLKQLHTTILMHTQYLQQELLQHRLQLQVMQQPTAGLLPHTISAI